MKTKDNCLGKFQKSSHDLQEALSMAQHFEETKKDDGYIIKEGWDIYDIINSLIVLSHAYKGRLFSGELKPLWKIKDEMISDHSDEEILEVAVPNQIKIQNNT